LFELEKTPEVQKLINITKSNSGISGPELARAHMKLGGILASFIDLPPEETTIVAMLRGGIFFAEGMYFQLNCKFQTHDPRHGKFIRPDTKHTIIADSVINTGRTILNILEPDMIVACCVINENALDLFGKQLIAVRVSKNSFVGCNVKKQSGLSGPDTTMRLFNQI